MYLKIQKSLNNTQLWEFSALTDELFLRLMTDALGTGTKILEFTGRSTSVSVDIAQFNLNHDNLDGLRSKNIIAYGNDTDHGPYLVLQEHTSGSVDNRAWIMESDNGKFYINAASDDWSVQTAVMEFNRTGTTVDNIMVAADVLPSGAGIDVGGSASRFDTVYGSTGDFGTVETSGLVDAGGGLVIPTAAAPAGEAGHITYTGDAFIGASGAALSVKGVTGATPRDSAGFIEVKIDTTSYYIPYFDAITG